MDQKERKLYQVNVGYACFSLEAKNNIVTLAPPIAKWMQGKTLQEIKPWLLKKKAKVIEVKTTT